MRPDERESVTAIGVPDNRNTVLLLDLGADNNQNLDSNLTDFLRQNSLEVIRQRTRRS